MTDLRVWCLLINHEKKAAVENAFSVILHPDACVVDLKKKVKEKLNLEHVDAAMLTVWRCTDSEIDFGDMDSDNINDRLNEVFSPNEEKVKKLKPKQELRQLTEKTLLIEVPDSLSCPSDLNELRHPVSAKKRKRDGDTVFAPSESQIDCGISNQWTIGEGLIFLLGDVKELIIGIKVCSWIVLLIDLLELSLHLD
ncbi:hypothetical protein A7U60_g3477 [Sanghuangporus baumii]|uniref:Crinkler effector protein N-terminal domain-containing protein n=1 Tax=Sanghuangporus baumii TaxID=108892 RepID=A0A9Q5NA61_SANBA|nr:hypothetical protein A7U60_g3477 [Sanghuangporus baumii]